MNKTLAELTPTSDDNRVRDAVMRAINQIDYALREHGLYTTVDADGVFGVNRLPPDSPLRPNERICEYLRRAIDHFQRQNRPLTSLRISDEHARKFASELINFQIKGAITEAEIYRDLISGTVRFMGLPISVYA
jgi:hypothetical protein